MNEKLKEFGKYLKSIRTGKNLSLRKLEELSGVSNAYISQLENGKRGTPSPDILKKISGPLEIEYSHLMEKAGYLDLHEDTITAIRDNDLDDLIAAATTIFFNSVSQDDRKKNEFKNYLHQQIQDMYSIDNIKALEIINKPDFLNMLIENLTLEEKISFLDILIKEFVDNDINPKDVFDDHMLTNNSVQTIKVPVLGYIAAGSPIFADEQIEEWTEIPNMWNLKEGEVIVLRVKGDSMIGSRIYDGDKVVVMLQSEVENGEIAVVNVNGDEATLKRVKRAQNGQTILYPDNPSYEPIFINSEKARIIGKVVQVMFEPK